MMSTRYGEFEWDDGVSYTVSVEDCYFNRATEEEVETRVKAAMEDRAKTGKVMIGVHYVVRPKTVFSINL